MHTGFNSSLHRFKSAALTLLALTGSTSLRKAKYALTTLSLLLAKQDLCLEL